jgi:hypothetical protein
VDIVLPVLLVALVGGVLLDVSLPPLFGQVSLAGVRGAGVLLGRAFGRFARALVAAVCGRDGGKSLRHESPPFVPKKQFGARSVPGNMHAANKAKGIERERLRRVVRSKSCILNIN